ncbi:hypothetical protein MRU69_02000 [Kocuria flava]|uniref:hypothetical protein n=1 Tax=Kocuria flava TaxID=446860 RepID=UPI001FF11483|nr:hypothetical protein [Kocuria flava]MCJ8503639.1 hypothetical protein [Kocuria flava]
MDTARATLLLGAALALGPLPAATAAPADRAPVEDPQEWTQYRLTPEKNPVLTTDGSAEPFPGGFALPDEVRSTPVV